MCAQYVPVVDDSALTPSAEPIFCFTSDLEWAPDWAIADLLSVFADHRVPLTPFVTHPTPVVSVIYDTPAMRRRVGIHPNFLPGSSHGTTVDEVIDTVLGIWPHAVSFRSHAFYEDSRAVAALKARGIRYDSNTCLFLQPDAVPLLHHTGLVRFPVFWEDDVHFTRGLDFDFAEYRARFDGPGLKVVNVHPLIVALNAPDAAFYEAHKGLNSERDPDVGLAARHGGRGARTFLEALLDHVTRRNARATYLDDLYEELVS